MHRNFEQTLIEHCAPTLAGVKTGNLFRYLIKDGENLIDKISILNDVLMDIGIRVSVIEHNSSCNTYLIYVHRPKSLSEDIQKPNVKKFLHSEGYIDCISIDDYIYKLSGKLHIDKNFPHEIGLFLGYPLDDVLGFIQNKGKNFKCCGYWKVYGNQPAAEKCFNRYKQCSLIYKKLYNRGTSIVKLAVAS